MYIVFIHSVYMYTCIYTHLYFSVIISISMFAHTTSDAEPFARMRGIGIYLSLSIYLSLALYIYIYIVMYTYNYIQCMLIYIYIHLCICTCIRVYMYICICMYVCIYIYIYIYICEGPLPGGAGSPGASRSGARSSSGVAEPK